MAIVVETARFFTFLTKAFLGLYARPETRRVETTVDELFQGRILLAEDDAWLAQVLTDTLLAAGFRVQRVADGVDAFDRAVEGRFDLLLLDLTLPRQKRLGRLRATAPARRHAAHLDLNRMH